MFFKSDSVLFFSYWYNQASQSLCPDLSNYSVTYIEVEVMTMSKTPVQFSVLLTKQYPREIGSVPMLH